MSDLHRSAELGRVGGHLISLEPNARRVYAERSQRDAEALVRICAHYFSHAAWLEEGALIRHAGRLAGIPGVLVHGRLDLSSPLDTAWELARAWPGAELVVVEDAGHIAGARSREAVLAALDRFADR